LPSYERSIDLKNFSVKAEAPIFARKYTRVRRAYLFTWGASEIMLGCLAVVGMNGIAISQTVSDILTCLITIPFPVRFLRGLPEDGAPVRMK
jgi:hypothetical protein